MAHLYSHGGGAGRVQPGPTGSMGLPVFKGGSAQDAVAWITEVQPAVARHLPTGDKKPISFIDPVVTCLGSCMPPGTAQARWLAQMLGLPVGTTALMGDAPRAPLIDCYRAEEWKRLLSTLGPRTLAVAPFQKHMFEGLSLLGTADLAREPLPLEDLFRRCLAIGLSHDGNIRFRPLLDPLDPRQGRLSPADAADEYDFVADTFSKPAHRRLFYPDLARLEIDRERADALFESGRAAVPPEWKKTLAFLSPESRAVRQALNNFPSALAFVLGAFRAQFAGDVTIEQQLLQQCVRLPGEAYHEWEARFRDLVLMCGGKLPFTTKELAEHFAALITKGWGREFRKPLAAEITRVGIDEDTMDHLYLYASQLLDSDDGIGSAFEKLKLLDPRSGSPISPRGRTSYPSSSSRDRSPGAHRSVSFDANLQYFDAAPSQLSTQTAPAPSGSHHRAVSNPAPDAPEPPSCSICHRHSANSTCYHMHPYLAYPGWAPAWDDPALVQLWVQRCRETQDWFLQPPGTSPPGATRSGPSPSPSTNPRAASSSSNPRRPPPRSGSRGANSSTRTYEPNYHRQPPPVQLEEQQRREQRRAAQPQGRSANVAAAAPAPEPFPSYQEQRESGFGAWVTSHALGGSGPPAAFPAARATRASSAATTQAAPMPAATPKPFRLLPRPHQQQAPRVLVVPRAPRPVGFAPGGPGATTGGSRQQPRAVRPQAPLALAAGVSLATQGDEEPMAEISLAALMRRAPALRELWPFFRDSRLVVAGIGSERYAVQADRVALRVPPSGLAALERCLVAEEGMELGGSAAQDPQQEEQQAAASAAALEACATTAITTPTTVTPTQRLYYPPTVAHLRGGDPALGASLMLNGRVISTPCAMTDSGANVNLLTEQLARSLKLKVIPDRSITVQGTAIAPTATIGRVDAPIAVGLAIGTAGALSVKVPLHVIATPPNQHWSLLLGTGFLGVVGARLCFDTSELQYLPKLPSHRGNNLRSLRSYTLPLITTTANPSPELLADLVEPLRAGD